MLALIYGDEKYLINLSLNSLKEKYEVLQLGINYIELDEENVEHIMSDIETPAFTFPRKLIVAKGTGLFKKKNTFSDKLATYLEDANLDDVDLIFIEDEKVDKNNLYKVIDKKGKVIEQNQANVFKVVQFIKFYLAKYKIAIDDITARYLIDSVGLNLQDITNELDKLIDYKIDEKKITKEDIDNLVTKKLEAVIFDLTDSIGKRNSKAAMEIFENLILSKEPAQKILIILYGHIKKLYITKTSSKDTLTENLKLKSNQSFLLSKYKMQANYFEPEELLNIIKELIKIDEKNKSGDIDVKIGLESVICTYCTKRG